MTTYVLKHKPAALKQAIEDLRRLDIEAFAPMEYRYVRKHPARKGMVARQHPALPGYLFVTCDLATLYGHVIHAKGIAYVLGNGGPLALPEPQRLALVALHQESPVIPVSRGLKSGDAVLITDGPFAGRMARVARVETSTSLRVLADWLGSLSAIVIATDKVEAA